MKVEQRSDNLVLNDDEIEQAALYVVSWNGWPPDDLQHAINRVKTLLRFSPEARGVALAGLRHSRKRSA